LVDKIVMVIRAGTTPRECLSEAIKSLGSDRVKGVILNGADFGPTSKYYYYYGDQS
jgi:Mrp family chromosome partitioning ATPase